MSGSRGKSSVRAHLRRLAAFVPLGWLPLDGMLRLAQRVAAGLAGLVFLRDWQLEARGRPQFFKHQINLSRWSFEPSRWAFSARGVHGRELMFRGCRVLDLCCGDGSYSYLFFSDVAGRIDAVDNDAYAIDYARKYRAAPAISYQKLDVVGQPLPASGYDVVVWNAAICYFRHDEIRLILRKVVAAGKPTMKLSGMLPRANRHPDHKTEFEDRASLERLLGEFFAVVVTREVDEGPAVTFHFQASDPLQSTKDRA